MQNGDCICNAYAERRYVRKELGLCGSPRILVVALLLLHPG